MGKSKTIGMLILLSLMMINIVLAFDPFRVAGNDAINRADTLVLDAGYLWAMNHSFINNTGTITNVTFYTNNAGVNNKIEFRCFYYVGATNTLTTRAIADENISLNSLGFQNHPINLSGCQIGDMLGYYESTKNISTGRSFGLEKDNTVGKKGIYKNSYCNPSCTAVLRSDVHEVSINYIRMDFSPPSASTLAGYLYSEYNHISAKTLFDEGEEIDAYGSWIDSAPPNDPINDISGRCNFSWYNGTTEEEASDNNFTLCSGCDYSNYTYSFNFDNVDDVNTDYMHFEACHENLAQGNIIATIKCENGNATYIIPSNVIPLCSSGDYSFTKTTESTICRNNTQINISLAYEGTPSRRKQITNLSFDKEYFIHKDHVHFNYTSELWELNHSTEYYSHGEYSMVINCSHNTDSGFTNSYNRSFTIVNKDPVVSINHINTTSMIQNFTSGVEYENGTWKFSASVSDDDLAFVNAYIYNSTGLVKSWLSIPDTSNLLINSSNFREFANPYLFIVYAEDTYGDSTNRSAVFGINDTSAPFCTGLNNITIINNTDQNWNVTCLDESFFSFNMSCAGSSDYSKEIYGLDLESWNWVNNTLITEDTLCTYEYCDGHTDSNINDMLITDETSKFKRTFDNKIELETAMPMKYFDLNKQADRYTFSLTPEYSQKNISFTIRSDEFIYIMDPAKYTGWIVTGDYWIDFVSKGIYLSKTYRISETEVRIDLFFRDYITTAEFQSIGKLNCVTGSQYITTREAYSAEGLGFLRESGTCFLDRDLGYILGYIFLMIIVLSFLVLNEIYIRYPILNIFVGLSFMFLSVPLYNCSWVLAGLFGAFGIFICLAEFYR